MKRTDLQYCLLQARNPNDTAKLDEHRAFAARLGVGVAQIESCDILSTELGANILEEKDVLLVGGAGEYSVLDDVRSIRKFIEFLAETAESGFPVFASCFGFQALVVGLGGAVVQDEPNAEVGTYQLRLTEEGKKDPLFGQMPEYFLAQLGHKDRASRLPSLARPMASSERTPYQAFWLQDKPVVATQFHPELTGSENRARFARYMDLYGKLFGAEEALARLNAHQESPEANGLLRRFVEMVLPSKQTDNP